VSDCATNPTYMSKLDKKASRAFVLAFKDANNFGEPRYGPFRPCTLGHFKHMHKPTHTYTRRVNVLTRVVIVCGVCLCVSVCVVSVCLSVCLCVCF
jgi:hypothetical protein